MVLFEYCRCTLSRDLLTKTGESSPSCLVLSAHLMASSMASFVSSSGTGNLSEGSDIVAWSCALALRFKRCCFVLALLSQPSRFCCLCVTERKRRRREEKRKEKKRKEKTSNFNPSEQEEAHKAHKQQRSKQASALFCFVCAFAPAVPLAKTRLTRNAQMLDANLPSKNKKRENREESVCVHSCTQTTNEQRRTRR